LTFNSWRVRRRNLFREKAEKPAEGALSVIRHGESVHWRIGHWVIWENLKSEKTETLKSGAPRRRRYRLFGYRLMESGEESNCWILSFSGNRKTGILDCPTVVPKRHKT